MLPMRQPDVMDGYANGCEEGTAYGKGIVSGDDSALDPALFA